MTEQRRLAAIVSAESRATREERRDAGSVEKSSAGGGHPALCLSILRDYLPLDWDPGLTGPEGSGSAGKP